MAKQSLGIGSSANDGTGDTLRAAADKVNDNFLEIYTLIGDQSSLTSGISATASVVTLTAPLVATSISPSSSDGATLGTTSLEWSDLFLADGAVVNFGDDQDVTLTHVVDTGLLLSSTDQLQFGDSGTYIHQSADGVLDLVSDTEIELNATTIDVNGNLDVSGTIVAAGTLTAATSITVGSAVLTEAELETLDGITAGTVIASKAIITDSSKDITGGRNITISGELDAATGDFSGDVDVDGTLEADAITINGVTLAETISDTVGAMVGSNTETGISVSYEDGDNTLDFVLGTTQTTITSLTNAALVIGRDADNDIDFATDNNIIFRAAGTDQIKLVDGALAPVTDAGVDLGTSSLEFKDAFFDGTVTSDAFAGPLTGEVTGNAATATALATARTIGGTSFDGSANIAVGLAATATALATARTIGGTSFDGTGNIAVALASVGTAVTVADESSDTTCFPLFTTAATGDLPPKSGSNLTFNSSSGLLTATLLDGDLTGDVTGNADTATTLATARTIGGTSFNGSANIAVALATAATTLETARTLGGVSFNGSANINLPGVNAAGNQSTSGLAATATALATARTIGGTSFDGSANIAVGLAAEATILETARTIGGTSFDGSANIAVGLATLATTVTITDNESTNESNALIFTAGGDVDGGNLGLESDGTLTYNPSTGKVTATGFVGTLTGNVTGNASGTALTVTQAAQTNITSVGTLTALQIDNLNLNGNTLSSTAGTDLLITPLSGQQIVLDGTIIIDAGVVTGATSITSTAFVGDITGDVTGTADEATALTGVTSTAAELNILDASAGNTAVASDVASSAGAITSNNAKIKHTLTLAAELADDAVHADVAVTSDKCLATSTVIANANLDVEVRIHTVVAGSFKVSITNLSGGALANDSAIILNYTII